MKAGEAAFVQNFMVPILHRTFEDLHFMNIYIEGRILHYPKLVKGIKLNCDFGGPVSSVNEPLIKMAVKKYLQQTVFQQEASAAGYNLSIIQSQILHRKPKLQFILNKS